MIAATKAAKCCAGKCDNCLFWEPNASNPFEGICSQFGGTDHREARETCEHWYQHPLKAKP